ncbi:MAG: hypothetical protein WBN04_11910 [Paracoccaceae bacterium]
MEKSGITVEDLIAGLQDIRLPSHAPGGMWAEILAAAGLGLLLACCVALVLPLITRRKSLPHAPTLSQRVAALSGLPEADRAVGLLHLLKQHDPEAAAQFGRKIYARGGLPDAATLEAALTGRGGGDA